MAYKAHHDYRHFIRREAQLAIKFARKNDKHIIVLAGRPYHIDPEINHGIDELITSLDMIVITEDALSHIEPKPVLKILNQWTYQSRMYSAARHILHHKDMDMVQLVSFGCGTDAITTDELRDILEDGGKLYTQIKIDEISNLGAARIRLRSLIAAINEK